MRWRPIVAIIGLFLIGLVAGIIARPRQDEHLSYEVGDGVHAKSLVQVREEPVETAALEERRQPEAGNSGIEQVTDEAKVQLANLNEQLVEMQKEVDRLRHEVSDAQRKLTQERETVTLLRAEAVRSEKTTAALQRRVEELNKALEERDYLLRHRNGG